MENNLQSKTFELGRMDVVDLYEWHTTQKINYSSYFQRKYVWREKDKVELIDTIVKGYPIPSIFLCEASTDYVSLKKKYNVLDGRQRLESIFSFINNEFKYCGKTFGEMSETEKEKITNFSIPIIQMYVKPNEVDKIKEIFKRLNKNSYNLNKIEIRSSQLVEYDFMIVCKILNGSVEFENIDDYLTEVKALYEDEIEEDDESPDFDSNEILLDDSNLDDNFISDYLKDLCKIENINNIRDILTNHEYIFSDYQIRRQVNLQYTINILGTIMLNTFIHRNLTEKQIIAISSEFSDNSPKIEEQIKKFNITCGRLIQLYKLQDLDEFWKNRSNFFTLSILFTSNFSKIGDIESIKNKLNQFSKNGANFDEYRRNTQERGNDRKVRERRNEVLNEILFA